MDVEESNSIYKDLNSHLIDPRALAEFNNDESIPSIFSCFHRSGVVEADSKGLSDTAQNVGEKRQDIYVSWQPLLITNTETFKAPQFANVLMHQHRNLS